MYVQLPKTRISKFPMIVKCVKFYVDRKCLYGVDARDNSYSLDTYDDDNTVERAYELIYDHLAVGDHAIKMSDIRKKLGLST